MWPSDLSVLQGDVMLIRETTHRFSPFSVHRAMVGRTWPVMASACGRAQLCFRNDEERESLLALLARSAHPGNAAARNRRFVDAMVNKARAVGYAESEAELEQKMSAIAIPVRMDGRVLASLSLIFFSSAMTTAEAAREHLAAMHDAADAITRALYAERERSGDRRGVPESAPAPEAAVLQAAS